MRRLALLLAFLLMITITLLGCHVWEEEGLEDAEMLISRLEDVPPWRPVRIRGESFDYMEFFNEQPYMDEHETIFIPTSEIKNVLYSDVEYYVKGDTVIISQRGFEYDLSIKLKVGSNIIRRNDKAFKMDTVPVMLDGIIYIPIKPVAEALEYRVSWDSMRGALSIRYYSVGIYVWSESEKLSLDGVRYALAQIPQDKYEIPDIFSRAVSDFSELESQLGNLPRGWIMICEIRRISGYEVIREAYTVFNDRVYDIVGDKHIFGNLNVYMVDDSELLVKGISNSADFSYSKRFTELGQKSLRDSEGEIYRLSFFYIIQIKTIITIEVATDGSSTIYTTSASGVVREKFLSEEETAVFLETVTEVDFWNQPGIPADGHAMGISVWIIEGVKDGRYKAIERTSGAGDPVNKMTDLFYELYFN